MQLSRYLWIADDGSSIDLLSGDYRRELKQALHQQLGPLPLQQAVNVLRQTLWTYMEVAEGRGLQCDAMFAPLQAFLQEPQEGSLDPAWIQRSSGRPRVRPDLEQMPCLPHTSQERARLAQDYSDILLLGDDDLVSLALPQKATVLEIDPALCQFLSSRNVDVRPCDLNAGLPDELAGRFSLVITDPPTNPAAFLQCARQALRKGGHLMLSAPPEVGVLEMELVQRRRNFNLYPMPPAWRDTMVARAACFDVPPELGRLLFGPPLFYSDLSIWAMTR